MTSDPEPAPLLRAPGGPPDGTSLGGAPTEAPRGRWRAWLPLAGVLALMAGLRLYHVGVPFIDTSDWRQTDTAAIAYFYYHLGVALLHPQLWHDGPGPDYTQLELQITPALAALLAHVFGYSHVLLRVVAIALDTASAIPLWALARRRLGPRAALWACLTYAVLPLGIYFGRVFQPEPAMLLTGNAALWAADRLGERPTPGRYLAAVSLLALAVLAKLPNALLTLPALVLALGPGRPRLLPRRGGRPAARGRLLQLAGLAALPALAGAAYTLAVGRNATNGTRYVTFIIRSLPSSYIAGQTNLWRFVWHNALGMAVTPAGGLAALAGLCVLLPRWRRGRHAWILAWGLALAAYALVVLRAIRLQYYLVPVLPWVALLAGVGLRWLAEGAGATRAAASGQGAGAALVPVEEGRSEPGAAAAPGEEGPPEAGAAAPGRTMTGGVATDGGGGGGTAAGAVAGTVAGTVAAWRRRLGAAAAGLLVVSMLSGGLFQIASYWPPYWPWYTLGLALRRALPASATILVGGTFNPTLLYYARRHGWRADPTTAATVEVSRADYLVPVVDPGACVDAFLATHYASFVVAGTRVYDLRQRLTPPAASGPATSGASSTPSTLAAIPGGTGVPASGCAATGRP